MFTFGQLVEFANRFDADARTSLANEIYDGLVADALQEFWNARRWPFLVGESSVALLAPYTTGTIGVTQDNTAITGTGTTWLTTWPTPGLLVIDGDPNEYLVSAYGSTTSLTVDKAIQRTTASGLTYSLYFPAYELPSDFLGIEMPVRANWPFDLNPVSYEEWMQNRAGFMPVGPCEYYAIVPASDTVAAKIYLWPAPSTAELLRFRYHKSLARCDIYRDGTVSVTNASTGVTGSGSLWAKQGFSMVGKILELRNDARGVTGTVASVTSDTAITLSANWSGATLSGKSYVLSSRINMPDICIPAIRELCKVKVAEVRRDYMGVEYWTAKAISEMGRCYGSMYHLDTGLEKEPAEDNYPTMREQMLARVPRIITRDI